MVPKPPDSLPLSSLHESRGPRRSVASLPSSIGSGQLRGVPMNVAMAGCGRRWKMSDEDEFHLSQPVENIDRFLSHEWGSSRWVKAATLLVYFNSVPAAVASLLVCAVVSVLIIVEYLDGWIAGALAIHVSYWLIFFCWQNMRGLCKKNTVFLDRLCIPQHDPELKKEGILALGGFLSNSRKLIVLWSPRYFTRLWTAFELSSFLRSDHERAKDIEFAPVSMGPFLLYFVGLISLLLGGLHVFTVRNNRVAGQEESSFSLLMIVVAICSPAPFIAPLVLSLGTRQMKAVLQLGKQVADFRIRDAQCSCCEMDHCHPETGEELLCDRELVFQTLKRWFPDEEESSDAHLDRFDDMVRKKLGGCVAKILGSGAPPLKYAVAISIHPLLGLLCHYVHLTKTTWKTPQGMLGWCAFPPLVYQIFFQFVIVSRMGVRFGHLCPLWLIFTVGIITSSGYELGVWMLYRNIMAHVDYDLRLQVLCFALWWSTLLIPCMCYYLPSRPRNGDATEGKRTLP